MDNNCIDDRLYSPQIVVVTTKYTMKKDLTRKEKGKNKTNGIYLSKLVIKQNM